MTKKRRNGTTAMAQSKKTKQERLPNRWNEINTFSVFRRTFFRTWFFFSLNVSFSLFFFLFRLIWMCLCANVWVWVYVVWAMLFFCLFVRFHTIVLQRQRGHIDLAFSNCVSLLLLMVFFSALARAVSFAFLYSSQFSPIWCLDDGNEAHSLTHRNKNKRRRKRRRTKSNKWKKVEQKQNCDGFYLPYCICGDRSVAWEWSNSHVYIELSTVVYCFFPLLASVRLHLFLYCASSSEFSFVFFLSNSREASSKNSENVWMAFSRRCRCQWQHRRFRLDSLFHLSFSLPVFFTTGHYFSSSFFLFQFSVFFRSDMFSCALLVCLSSYLFCVGHFSVFSLNCELLLHMRVEKMRVYVKHIYTLLVLYGSTISAKHVDIDATEYEMFLDFCVPHTYTHGIKLK